MVRDLGPLWVTSCFPQESINGEIIKMIHGTRFVERQIASSLHVSLSLPQIISGMKDSAAKEFCSEAITTTHKCKSFEVGNVTVLGEGKPVTTKPPHLSERFHELELNDNDPITAFHSIRKNKCLYVADCHPSSRDSSSVLYSENGLEKVGLLKQFYVISSTVYADIQILDATECFETLVPDVTVPNIKLYNITDNYIIVNSDSLHDVCIKMLIDGRLYIAKRCNTKEVE
ncbi:7-cyano-7-deazaguanine synthase [Frankliniella fusca]|uniref:7-cyano-7-deazaguanine synthase n=1 Tax=Frankliniella fusca TaxID=407009 RepID=A0AAE1HRX3_9NEOP|nr:7-cyano-7-deazaguanine synthase [Frankliniella fusca]